MKMSSIRIASLLLLAVLLVGPAGADEGHRGFFVDGTGQVLVMDGTGTWGGYDFSPTGTMSPTEEGDDDYTRGLNWSERILLGISPGFGYRFGDQFSVQANYLFFFPVRSSESYTTTEAGGTYVQALDWEWRQSALEATAWYYPNYSDTESWNLFLYGGVQMLRVEVDAATSESLTALLGTDEMTTLGDYGLFQDSFTAWGAIGGVGVEIPSDSMNVSTVVRLQYALTPVDRTLFGTPDFDVQLGGFSIYGGLKWYFAAD